MDTLGIAGTPSHIQPDQEFYSELYENNRASHAFPAMRKKIAIFGTIFQHAWTKLLKTMNFFGDPIHIQTKQFVILCTLGIYRHVQPQPPKKKSYPKYIINQKICNIWNMIDYLYFFQVGMFQACFRHAQSSRPM